eukprot:scaffold119145_cov33-Phaeocystis_antarctica.AAC.2
MLSRSRTWSGSGCTRAWCVCGAAELRTPSATATTGPANHRRAHHVHHYMVVRVRARTMSIPTSKLTRAATMGEVPRRSALASWLGLGLG